MMQPGLHCLRSAEASGGPVLFESGFGSPVGRNGCPARDDLSQEHWAVELARLMFMEHTCQNCLSSHSFVHPPVAGKVLGTLSSVVAVGEPCAVVEGAGAAGVLAAMALAHACLANCHMCNSIALAIGFSASGASNLGPSSLDHPVNKGCINVLSRSFSSLASKANVAGVLVPLTCRYSCKVDPAAASVARSCMVAGANALTIFAT